MRLQTSAGGGRSTVSAAVVRGLVEAVEQAGVARAQFLQSAQLDSSELSAQEARFPRATVARWCELALDMSADPALGLHWVGHLSERAFAPLSHMIAHCSTLRQSLALLAQFFGLLGDDAPYRVCEDEQQLTIQGVDRAYPSLRLQRFQGELMVGGFWRLLRSFNAHARPTRVCFAYPAPSYQVEYTRMFEAVPRFDQPFTGLVFERALLDANAPQQDDDVRAVLQVLAEQRLQRVTQSTPYATRAREFLISAGWPHRTDMRSVARALQISERSLRRRLESERKPYNEILDEVKASLAKRLLREPRLTIQEVAHQMNFSDPSTFHRAFKRWTGATPSAYRERCLHT